MKENKNIKIFVDGHVFDREYQGTAVFIRELYRSLSKLHPEIDLYVGSGNKENLRQQLPFVPAQNILAYRWSGLSLSRHLVDVPLLIRRHGFDFAHFQYVSPFAVRGCRYIVTTHDVLFNDFRNDFPKGYAMKRNFLFRRSLSRADVKTTVSSYAKDRIIDLFGIKGNEIEILPNGIRDYQEKMHRQQENPVKKITNAQPYILMVSRIEPRKNQLLLLDTFLRLQLHKKGLHLVFIGALSIDKGFRSGMGRLEAEEKKFVHWIEELSNDDLQAAYRDAQLFVYPSKAEGFGIPPLEAAANLAPVLCSGTTAMQDFDFFDPWRFDPSDEKDFTAKLIGIMENPPSYEQRLSIREKIFSRYNWVLTARKFYHLLQKAIA